MHVVSDVPRMSNCGSVLCFHMQCFYMTISFFAVRSVVLFPTSLQKVVFCSAQFFLFAAQSIGNVMPHRNQTLP